MPLTPEQIQYYTNLPDLRDVAMQVQKGSISTEFNDVFTIKTYLMGKNGYPFILILTGESGKEYKYSAMPTEYDRLRKAILKSGKLIGRKVVISFFTGSLGPAGMVQVPKVVVTIDKILPAGA